MTEREAIVGANVALIRGDRSQQAVAEAMRERGWKWSQATVWSVEKGERPLRLLEAEDLADVLGVLGPSQFTSPPWLTTIQSWMHRCGEAKARLEQAARDFLDVQTQLRFAIAEAAEAGEKLGEYESGVGWLNENPSSIAQDATYLWEHEDEADERLHAAKYRDRADRAAIAAAHALTEREKGDG